MPISITDSKGKRHTVSLTDAFFSGGRTIRTRKPPTQATPAGEGDKAKSSPAKSAGDGTAKDQNESQKNTEKKDEDKNGKAEGEAEAATATTSTWTEAEEKELCELKTGGKTWADIASKLGKPKKEVQKRYGELRAANEKNKKGEKDKTESAKEAEKRENVTAGPKLPVVATFERVDPDAEIDPLVLAAVALITEGGPFSDEANGPGSCDSINSLNVDEALLLARLQGYYEELKWAAIITKLYARTGKRLDPKELKERWIQAREL